SFADKNEIIDWLRAEGLPFARASWLERIHRNGGKPIHADVPAGAAAPSRHDEPSAEPKRSPRPARVPHIRVVPDARLVPDARPAAEASRAPEVKGAAGAAEPPAHAAAELEKLVSAAKGYRPLYHLLEAQIRQAIPGVVVAPRGRYVSLGAPLE